jgi:site-specific DNA-methyltransferase (adenine-specific)
MDIKERREPEINLSLGCSLQAMREMKDNQYDLAIVDPPYGIGNWIPKTTSAQSSKDETRFNSVTWNNTPPPKEYFTELKRVSKKQIIWGANYYKDIFPSAVLVWYKNIGNQNFSQVEIASLSWGVRCDYVQINWSSGFHRVIKEGEQIHPCQKPIALYKWLLDKYAKEGDKILDTHLGSGSIACACYDMGFDLDAFEIDTDYYKDTLLRYTEYSKQCKLF